MNRHKKILEYVLSSLLRRKYKNLSLIFIFSVIIATLASILFLTHSLRMEAMRVFIGSPDIIVQNLSLGRHELIPIDYMEKIKQMPGVKSVYPRYWGYYYDSLTEANYTVLALSKETGELEMLDGAMPRAHGECAVGKGVSDVRLAGMNEEIFLALYYELTLKITGIFNSQSALLTNDLIVITKDDFVSFFNVPQDKATDLFVEISNPSEITTIANKIKRIYPSTRPIRKSEIVRTYEALFNWRSGMALTMFAGALLAFCIFAWDKATGLSVMERQEIGILKAIGWETSDILELKFWEGAVISLTSFLTGFIFAYIHVFYTDAFLFIPALKGWSVLFPPFKLTAYIDLYQILTLFFLTVMPYTASTIIPSWKAAVTDPDLVMRN
ncbi:membrane protein containing DUF214, permase predicted [Candidatus Magnetoovum chiemensis]|nr:membrane protein containing DUF214, permase predicted [Candidatus Magnetoovum chiemensis]